MAQDTNFKDYDPDARIQQENAKDRGESYGGGKDFDATHGHANVTDDNATSDMAGEADDVDPNDDPDLSEDHAPGGGAKPTSRG